MSEISKLPKAPLQEVIFEVRWELDISPFINKPEDNFLKMALGVFSSLVKKEFPYFVSKYPQDIPSFLVNYQPTYQFWMGENTWPVYQLGPGIFTVNETEKNYEWQKHFYPLLNNGLKYLIKAYGKELPFNFVSLRYIDVVRVADYGTSGWKEFIEKNFNFKFDNLFNQQGKLSQIQFTQVFKQKDDTDLIISLSNGKNNLNEDIFIWETAVQKNANFTLKDLKSWINQNHKLTSKIFKEICKDEFYDSFTRI